MTRVVVVGAGMIGAACAWRLTRRGTDVTLVDPHPGRGAWHTAAGMLAAVSELHYTEADHLPLSLASLERYPDFVAELGADVGYVETGTLVAAFDHADLAALTDLHAFGQRHGVRATVVGGRELHALEPALAPGLPGALHVPGDHQVDPRRLHAALISGAVAGGARLVADGAATVAAESVSLRGGKVLNADAVIVTAGAWTGRLVPVLADIRPVQGQTIRLRADPGTLTHVVRATVKSRPVYLVPRPDGEVVIGATTEEAGFDLGHRAGGIYDLLRDAFTIVPELSEAEFAESTTGLRPGSATNAPVIGRLDDGVIVATGHYRNGVLLAPVTADAIARLVVDGALPTVAAPFVPATTTGVAR